jgi:hypothetical protein
VSVDAASEEDVISSFVIAAATVDVSLHRYSDVGAAPALSATTIEEDV